MGDPPIEKAKAILADVLANVQTYAPREQHASLLRGRLQAALAELEQYHRVALPPPREMSAGYDLPAKPFEYPSVPRSDPPSPPRPRTPPPVPKGRKPRK